MNYYTVSLINLILFFLPIVIGIKHYNLLEKALKVFLFFAISSSSGELIAFFCALIFKNNLPIYNLFSIINLVLLCGYFREQLINESQKKAINLLITFSILFWLFSIFYLHSINSINSIFLGYQGIVTMCLSAYIMEYIVFRQSRTVFNLKTSPHFLIAILLLVYWCFSIMQWILYRIFTRETPGFHFLDISLIVINMSINFCFTIVFLKYPKMIKSNGH